MIQSLGFIAIMMNIDMLYLSSTYQQGICTHPENDGGFDFDHFMQAT